MTNKELFEIGEQVLVPMKVIRREFDDRGTIKYKLKDQKSGRILDWFFTDKDIISDPNFAKKEIKTNARTTKK